MRTVAALYDTRAEAETAHARLSAEVKAEQVRIISRETAGALGTLGLAAKDLEGYREGLNRGSFLIVASVATGEDPDRIVQILQQSRAGDGRRSASLAGGLEQGGAVEEVAIPRFEEELRIGKREVARGGARVRTFTREQDAEQDVLLKDEHIDADLRPVERRLTTEEVERGGLLKDRVIEVSEMREEPVITKEAYVREEVVVTKSVSERVETIRDTVRRTEVEIDDLAAPAAPETSGR